MFGKTPLVPAYGRDYKSIKAVKKDWDDGKDFKTPFGQCCSKKDFVGKKNIEIRYAKLTKLIFVNG